MFKFLRHYVDNSNIAGFQIPKDQIIDEEKLNIYLNHTLNKVDKMAEFLKAKSYFEDQTLIFMPKTLMFLINTFNPYLSK